MRRIRVSIGVVCILIAFALGIHTEMYHPEAYQERIILSFLYFLTGMGYLIKAKYPW